MLLAAIETARAGELLDGCWMAPARHSAEETKSPASTNRAQRNIRAAWRARGESAVTRSRPQLGGEKASRNVDKLYTSRKGSAFLPLGRQSAIVLRWRASQAGETWAVTESGAVTSVEPAVHHGFDGGRVTLETEIGASSALAARIRIEVLREESDAYGLRQRRNTNILRR